MHLLRNPEVLRLTQGLVLVFILFILLAAAAANLSLQHHMQPILDYQAAIIGTLVEQFPEAERSILHQLDEVDPAALQAGRALLARYGYDADALLYNTHHLQDYARDQAWLILSLVILLFVTLITIFYLFLRRRYRIVAELHDYAGLVANGQRTMDIRDNGEGEFSILKNQVYTITTMLKEQAAVLKREKLALSDSIADISHQLKTPLTSLSVMTDLLMEEPAPEMRKQFLERIRSQLDRMEWLTASLLKLAKLDAGTITLERRLHPVNQLVQSALESLNLPLELKQHQVVISGDPHVKIQCDKGWTTEALVNILKNCIEHTPEQGRIHISWETNPIYDRLTIADNGEGIPAKDLPYIFNRFYKGSNARDDSIGIGLAMAHAIIQQQSGDITVSSEAGEGTTFTITFYKQRL